MSFYTISESKQGNPTLLYNDGSKQIRIHSAYDPIKEAQRAVDNFTAKSDQLVVILGLGLAYHVELLKKKFPDHYIFVIEKDHEVIKFAEEYSKETISEIRVLNSLQGLAPIFDEIDISTFKGIATYTHRASYSLDSKFYDSFLIDINKYISSKISDLLTRFEFEEQWVENILENIPYIFKSQHVKSLFNKFTDYPGIIVSAGPSLRKNIQHLKKLQDKALIVCVDTAFKVMLKSGITPHFVMVLDAQKHSEKHFQGINNFNSILLADLVSCPKVLQKYKGHKVISTTSKYYSDNNNKLKRETTPFIDWLEMFVDPVGDIQSGGSVATSLFDFLLNLGCSEIILVGQDLAYTGREIHSSGTHHNDNWLPLINRFYNLETINQRVIRKRKIEHIPAYGKNNTVVSDYVLNLYRQWFEDSADRVNIPVINATEGGAFIENTKEISLSNINQNLNNPEQSPLSILNKYLNQEITADSSALKEGIKSALINFKKVLNLTQIEHTNQHIHELEELLNSEILISIFRPFLKKTRTYLTRHQDMPEENKNKLFISDVKRSCIKMIKLFEKCLTSLNN